MDCMGYTYNDIQIDIYDYPTPFNLGCFFAWLWCIQPDMEYHIELPPQKKGKPISELNFVRCSMCLGMVNIISFDLVVLAWADENEDAGTWKSTPGHEVSLTHIGIPAISFQGRSAKGESQNLGLTFRNIELGIWHLVLSWCWLGTLSPCVSSTKAWMQDHRIIPVSGEKNQW